MEKKKIEWYAGKYLRTQQDALDPLASPMLGSVAGVCPAAIFVAGFDPLRDEGIAYAEKLKSANIPTDLKLYEGVIHPFINVAGKVPIAREIFEEVVTILKRNI